MKKLILTLITYCFVFPAYATGPYDGIWQSPDHDLYMTIHEKDGVLILVALSQSGQTYLWNASSGVRTDNKAELKTVVGNIEAVVDLTMTSDTTFVLE